MNRHLPKLAARIPEQERGTVGSDDPTVDLGDLEIGIDGGVDLDEFTLTAQGVDEVSQVPEQGAASRSLERGGILLNGATNGIEFRESASPRLRVPGLRAPLSG